jgi:3-oxo-5-alpha-steroid 4-dehydrogenase 1
MDERSFFSLLIWAWLGLALVAFITLFFIEAPYGRLAKNRRGPTLRKDLGWFVMEAPAALIFALFFVMGTYTGTITAWVFLGLWQFHYMYRAFIYPFWISRDGKKMLLLVVSLGIFHNIVNAYINGRYLYTFSGGYPDDWLSDPRFLIGVLLFFLGAYVNRHSDRILRNLRQPGESGYKIPHGGLFKYVTAPNYLGEIIQWIGWAIATWSLPGLAFAIWSLANLGPRALSYHYWYRKNFPDYPKERTPLIPFIKIKGVERRKM